MEDGGIRVKVKQSIWISYRDENGVWKYMMCRGIEDRGGPPVKEIWLFTDCAGEKFASNFNSDISNTLEQDVFHREGRLAGRPKHGSAAGNLFKKWVKLCNGESLEGKELIRKGIQ